MIGKPVKSEIKMLLEESDIPKIDTSMQEMESLAKRPIRKSIYRKNSEIDDLSSKDAILIDKDDTNSISINDNIEKRPNILDTNEVRVDEIFLKSRKETGDMKFWAYYEQDLKVNLSKTSYLTYLSIIIHY